MRRNAAPPAVIAAGGVFLPAEVCHPLWDAQRKHIARHRADGGQVRPEVAAALDAMLAALAHLSATDTPNGHPRTSAHLRPMTWSPPRHSLAASG
ncbi:hypothetical protein [Streptomyces sp. NPDC059909]|uniref:hypothetical protein n=1 Tax=Streptomyces sp. NPDC059909 TaxID=3346998 RepID=UPI003664202B